MAAPKTSLYTTAPPISLQKTQFYETRPPKLCARPSSVHIDEEDVTSKIGTRRDATNPVSSLVHPSS